MPKPLRNFIYLIISLLIIFASCDSSHSPKPRGYFRIDLPEKAYQTFDTTYPYSFKHPVYSEMVPDTREGAGLYWADLEFPRFDATIHISYKEVWGNKLKQYIEDARTFTNKQIPKATAINHEVVVIPDKSVYGMIYHIEGPEAASTLQFFVTDSVDHFLRGALYFNVTPNNDSLAPVIDFIKEDVDYMIETFKWE